MHLSPATGRGAGRCRGRLDEVGGWAWTRRIKGADHSIDEIGPVKVDGSGSGEVDIILSLGDLRWVQSWDRSWALEMDELLRRTFMKRRMQPGVPK